MFYWHFKELKLRFCYIITGVLATFLIGYIYSHEVLFLFTKPLVEIMNKPNMPFIFTELTEAFLIRLKELSSRAII